jgi:hypothetical protein
MREALKECEPSSRQTARGLISKARRSTPSGVGRFVMSVRLSYAQPPRAPREKSLCRDSRLRNLCWFVLGMGIAVVVQKVCVGDRGQP